METDCHLPIRKSRDPSPRLALVPHASLTKTLAFGLVGGMGFRRGGALLRLRCPFSGCQTSHDDKYARKRLVVRSRVGPGATLSTHLVSVDPVPRFPTTVWRNSRCADAWVLESEKRAGRSALVSDQRGELRGGLRDGRTATRQG
jgi:hypothetical protein